MARRPEISGLKELEQAFLRLGKVPQAAATRSARDGGKIALNAAKSNAPVDTGELRDGIILKGERLTTKGKRVFDVMMDPAKNNVFVKNTGKLGHKRAYYPASQEYGFLTVDGGYVPGYRFLRRAIDENAVQIEKKMLETTGKEIDKALRKR